MTTPFLEMTTTKKGTLGEQYVIKTLEADGYQIYQRVSDGPHHFDFVCYNESTGVIIVEVKTKSKRWKFDDTGIDEKHYNGYKRIQEILDLKMWLWFNDEEYKMCYGGYLDDIDVNKHIEDGIVYFYLSNMVFIRNLPDEYNTKINYNTTKLTAHISTPTKEEIDRVRLLFINKKIT